MREPAQKNVRARVGASSGRTPLEKAPLEEYARVTMSSEKVRDRIDVLVDLFMGAACADAHLKQAERATVQRLLQNLMLRDELPEEVQARIDAFDPDRFSLSRAAMDFASDPPMKKRRLLELVAQVVAADDVFDLAEDEYLRELAKHLGMELEDYADLVLDYEIEELAESFDFLRDSDAKVPSETRRLG
jgi:uncharacterized tellurite resistance protein B-like protein